MEKSELFKLTKITRSPIDSSADEYRNKLQKEIRNLVSQILDINICEALSSVTVVFSYERNGVIFNIPFAALSSAQIRFFQKNVAISLQEAIQLCFDTLFQNNELWKVARKIRITASIAYKLFTYYQNNHNEDEWKKKVDEHLSDNFQGTADTKHGIAMEEKARRFYEKATGNKIQQVGFMVNHRIPWLGCSPDGIVKDVCLIEIKSPKIVKTKSISESIKCIKYLQVNGKSIVFK